jgi:hypothetical protein
MDGISCIWLSEYWKPSPTDMVDIFGFYIVFGCLRQDAFTSAEFCNLNSLIYVYTWKL